MLNRDRVQSTVRYVVGLLAVGDYEALARLSTRGGLSADELRGSVEDYGHTILAEPFEASAPELTNDEAEWWTDVDLHTAEEGRSDLTLSMTLFDSAEFLYDVRLNDLHVL